MLLTYLMKYPADLTLLDLMKCLFPINHAECEKKTTKAIPVAIFLADFILLIYVIGIIIRGLNFKEAATIM